MKSICFSQSFTLKQNLRNQFNILKVHSFLKSFSVKKLSFENFITSKIGDVRKYRKILLQVNFFRKIRNLSQFLSYISMFIHFLKIANYKFRLVFYCQFIHFQKHIFRNIIIRIYKSEKFSCCSVYSEISSITQTTVFFRKSFHFLRKFFLKPINNFLRIICTPIVNCQNFNLFQSLIHQRI